MFNVVSLVIWNTDLTIMDIYNLTIEGISGERDGPWILSVLRWAGVSLSESPLFIIKTHLASLPPHLSWAELGSRHYFPASYIKLWRYRLADKPLWSGELARAVHSGYSTRARSLVPVGGRSVLVNNADWAQWMEDLELSIRSCQLHETMLC